MPDTKLYPNSQTAGGPCGAWAAPTVSALSSVLGPWISFTKFRRPYLTGRATIGRLELPPGEGRFVGPLGAP